MKLMQGKFCLQSMQQDVRLYSRKGSLMQGVIMERIRPTYGEVLHRSELKPYSPGVGIEHIDARGFGRGVEHCWTETVIFIPSVPRQL